MNDSDTTWIDVHIKSATENAYRVDNGHRQAWIPKRAILDYEDELKVGAHIKIEIATWLAEEKELI